MTTRRQRLHPHDGHGSAILVVLVLASAGFSLVTFTARAVRSTAEAVAARGDVLCADFAARGAVRTSPEAAATLADVYPALSSLTLETRRVRNFCVYVAEAGCGRAKRLATRDVDERFCRSPSP